MIQLQSKTHEQFCSEVYSLYGDKYKILDTYKNSHTHVLVYCNDCEKSFPIKPVHLLDNHGCPQCSSSRGEKRIRLFLENNFIDYIHQKRFKDCKIKRELPFDFAVFNNQDILICLIEYDGEQHYKPVKFYGCDDLQANLSHDKLIKNDKLKNDYCKRNKIQLLRIPYWEFDNIETILKENLGGIN
jgi:hypothetical protein